MRMLAGLIVICVLGAAEPGVKQFSKTIPLKPGTLVSVQGEDGNIEVAGWDQQTLEVRARIEMEPGMFRSKYAVEDTEIKVDETEGAVQIRADFSRIQQSSWSMLAGAPAHPTVHFQLRVPRANALRVHTVTGSTNVQNIRGEVNFEGVRGQAKFSGLEGPVRLKSVLGDIELRMSKAAGPSVVETVRGTITVYLPAKSKFNIDPDVGRAAEVTSDFGAKPGEAVKEPTKVNGGGPSYRVSARRGAIAFKKL